ncbi:MAG: tail fiber domain-containing protein, partial [Ignavibacteriae bacterium]|nr:tail fiber domain-containing protein [Ignavibacteriota bacterium]
TGNVGIGMPNPSYKLDVAGDARVKNTFYVGDPAGKHIFMYNTGSLVDITSAGSPLTINHSSGNNTYINAGGGNVGIGTESPSHKLHVNGEMRVSKIWDDDVNYYIDINAGARTGGNWNFNGNVGIQTTNMNVPLRVVNAWCDGGWWYNASDRTLKNDIQDLSKYGLSTVMKLRPVSFSYKNDEKKNTQIGFIAQEVKEIVPEVVSGEEGSMGMSYGNLTAILVNAIKEQQKQIEELKAEIQELKKK